MPDRTIPHDDRPDPPVLLYRDDKPWEILDGPRRVYVADPDRTSDQPDPTGDEE